MTENEQALAFDVEDLPDLLSQAEAFWMLNAMAYSAALANAYRLILADPKARADWTDICQRMDKAIRRIYPTGEASYLINLGHKRGLEGAKVTHERMKEEEAKNGAEVL